MEQSLTPTKAMASPNVSSVNLEEAQISRALQFCSEAQSKPEGWDGVGLGGVVVTD